MSGRPNAIFTNYPPNIENYYLLRKSLHEPRSSVENSLNIHVYEYKPSLKQDTESADLVISHAGAGSVLEALRMVGVLIPSLIFM